MKMEPYDWWVGNWEEETFGRNIPSRGYYKKCEKIYYRLSKILPQINPPVPMGDAEFEFTLRFKDYMVVFNLCGPKTENSDSEEDSLEVGCFTWPENKNIRIEEVFSITVPPDIVRELFNF